ncbi:hypothetical protein [Silvimonas amylolytica]|uniref:Transposase n=1 Tax=Silvimonas amylolytica TaxID=449663 RepID=A0ABQ2PK11_9NEIS|nr:hypothetical protein [Silvimonas amylolytica]GGP25939.1 hypothetical protein GCM10010971_17580 [Silvimonas amylolytica]
MNPLPEQADLPLSGVPEASDDYTAFEVRNPDAFAWLVCATPDNDTPPKQP